MACQASRRNGRFCSAINCTNCDRKCPEMSFFKFPKDKDRCKRWVINTRRGDLLGKPEDYLNRNCVLCPEHFEDALFYSASKDRLLKWAIPTIFKVPNPPPSCLSLKRLAPSIRTPITKRLKMDQSGPVSTSGDVVHRTCQEKRSPDTCGKQSCTALGNKVKELRKKNHRLRMQVHRLKKRYNAASIAANKSVSRALSVLHKKQWSSPKRKLARLRIELSKYLPGSALDFFMSQLAMAHRCPRGRRWTAQQKAFCLSLLHSSPKTYRLLCKVFALPSPRILKRAVQSIQIYPGVNENILEALRMKTAKMSAQDKLVVLVIDEMSIRQGLSYDQGRDIIEGVAQGKARTNSFASHAIVFMVRGVAHKWKQPLGYYLSNGPMKGSEMKPLLLSCIDHLQAIGLTVLVVISDQGSNNLNLFGTELGVSPEKPFFTHGSMKVFVLYDPPHLLKSMRNNLKKHGFTIEAEDKVDIMWDHIVSFYETDSSKPVRLAPKLTRCHIDIPPFKDLRVHLAAQVMSHSVATGMAFMAQWNIIPEEAKHTAIFLEKMDKLFNCFNSRSLSSKSEMSHAFSATSGHQKFLEETLTWLKRVKTKGTRSPACLKGWQLSINSLLQLWTTLSEDHGFRYLLTNRLNQDCLENFFSVIGAKGAGHDNPDAKAFRASFAQAMVASILQGDNTNCKEDLDEFLLSLDSLPAKSGSKEQVFQVQPSPYEALVSVLPENLKGLLQLSSFQVEPRVHEAEELSFSESNVLAYIAGYIIRRLRGKMCNDCTSKLICSSESESDGKLEFIKLKKYAGAKDGLILPSKAVLDV